MALAESENARVLSVDVGSSSVRAALHDARGDAIEDSAVKLDHEFDYTPDGGATMDADELLDLVARAVDGALSRAAGAAISCVAAGTFWHSVLGVGEDGRPTTPVLTWADRRAADASAAAASSAAAINRARSIRMACSRFCNWERSFWQETTMPLGRCVIRTAESVVFTPCPPGPEDR